MDEKIKMRKRSEISDEEIREIIEYTKNHSVWAARNKYRIYPETIRYWIYPKIRETRKKEGKLRYDEKMKDPAFREASRARSMESHQKNPDYYKQYLEKNKDRIYTNTKNHRQENLEHYKQMAAKRHQKYKKTLKDRRQNDIIFRLKHNIREGVRRALKYGDVNKEMPSIKYLGCNIEEFKCYIESQFKEGMGWDNHGRGCECWHLDHKIPLAVLTEDNMIDKLKEVCHYTNYQPLWEFENLSKNAKIEITDN